MGTSENKLTFDLLKDKVIMMDCSVFVIMRIFWYNIIIYVTELKLCKEAIYWQSYYIICINLL